jgi:hypothetical protein
MKELAPPPSVHPGDWIVVGNQQCVVRRVYPNPEDSGVCEVVFNKQKPTTHDVDWNGQDWFFPERPDYGGYGRDGDPYVQQLKRGRYA